MYVNEIQEIIERSKLWPCVSKTTAVRLIHGTIRIPENPWICPFTYTSTYTHCIRPNAFRTVRFGFISSSSGLQSWSTHSTKWFGVFHGSIAHGGRIVLRLRFTTEWKPQSNPSPVCDVPMEYSSHFVESVLQLWRPLDELSTHSTKWLEYSKGPSHTEEGFLCGFHSPLNWVISPTDELTRVV